jgi:DNA-directed RNA polymerase specialized sigma24 family protein
MDAQEEIARLLAIQLRLQLGSQSEAIQELNKVGFGPSRIADLLGTTSNTVNVTIQKAKKKGARKEPREVST